MMKLLEKWLKHKNIKTLKIPMIGDVETFYANLGYENNKGILYKAL